VIGLGWNLQVNLLFTIVTNHQVFEHSISYNCSLQVFYCYLRVIHPIHYRMDFLIHFYESLVAYSVGDANSISVLQNGHCQAKMYLF